MKFRKKPVVIEAIKWDGTEESTKRIQEWAGDEQLVRQERRKESHSRFNHDFKNVLHVGTLEGLVYASPGDWIIRGVHGELYPCKPDIFDETYEAVA